MNNHPMLPSQEQLAEWETKWLDEDENADVLLIEAYAAGAVAGADAELEGCCEWLDAATVDFSSRLRAARRPKPPSLKQQALEAQQRMWNGGSTHADWELIRRALEALPDDLQEP